MPAPREKQQGHQQVQQLSAHRQAGLGPRVVHLVHGHAHLGVDGRAGQLRDIEEKVYRHAQEEADGHLQQGQNHELSRPHRNGHLLGAHRRHKDRQHQHHARAEGGGDGGAAQDGVEENKSAYAGDDKQEEGQLRPVNHGCAPLAVSWRSA